MGHRSAHIVDGAGQELIVDVDARRRAFDVGEVLTRNRPGSGHPADVCGSSGLARLLVCPSGIVQQSVEALGGRR
jgi:hypothetical protein